MTFLAVSHLILICSTFPAIVLGGSSLGNSTKGADSLFDDRININHNYGHAHARNPDGSYSGSDASSYGYKAGILYPGGVYRPLASQTGSNANSYSGGRNPPSTFANVRNQVGPGGVRGNANAGFTGGRGNAYAGSHSQQIAIPLGGGFGGVLLSNLRPIDQISKKPVAETPTPSEVEKHPSDKTLTPSDSEVQKRPSEPLAFD